MAVDDFWESPVFMYGPGWDSLAANITDNRIWQDLHASKNADEQQNDEYGSIEDKAEMY